METSLGLLGINLRLARRGFFFNGTITLKQAKKSFPLTEVKIKIHNNTEIFISEHKHRCTSDGGKLNQRNPFHVE